MSLLEAIEVISTAISNSELSAPHQDKLSRMLLEIQTDLKVKPVVSKKKVLVKKSKSVATPVVAETVATHTQDDELSNLSVNAALEVQEDDTSPQDETVLEETQPPQPVMSTAMSPMDYDKMLEHFHALQELLADRAPHLVELLEDIKIEASSL
jgi:hypothetical protein